jgi:hypothetical protein
VTQSPKYITGGGSALAGVQSVLTGLLALGRGEPGQVRKEAATADCSECRGQGSSSPSFKCH